MLKEAAEEAGLTTTHHANLLQNMHAVGTISFFLDAGPAKGYVPETEFLYDIALPPTFTPTPQDGEVESFHLWDMPTIRGKLHEFTPESALVVVDFMIRHGLVTAESERDYVEVVRLLQHDLCGLPGP